MLLKNVFSGLNLSVHICFIVTLLCIILFSKNGDVVIAASFAIFSLLTYFIYVFEACTRKQLNDLYKQKIDDTEKLAEYKNESINELVKKNNSLSDMLQNERAENGRLRSQIQHRDSLGRFCKK